MYKAIEVAKLVVNACAEDGHPVTNLKLQKILYFMWLDWYRERKEYLFNDRIEGWHYGPVVPDIYWSYRVFIAEPIKKKEEPSIGGYDAGRLRELALGYNGIPVGTLIGMSCEDGSPWDRAGRDETPYSEISKMLMVDEAESRRAGPHAQGIIRSAVRTMTSSFSSPMKRSTRHRIPDTAVWP